MAVARRVGHELERELDDDAARADRRLPAPQGRTEHISRLIEQLAERVVRIKAGLHTLTVNREIVKRVLAGPTGFRGCQGLGRVVVDDLADFLLLRATTELGFRRPTIERGRVHMANLDATVGLRQAEQSRRLALVATALAWFRSSPCCRSCCRTWGTGRSTSGGGSGGGRPPSASRSSASPPCGGG